MKKVIKATIATAAGIALLGAGAGSLAYWSVTVPTNELEVSTGYLEFTNSQNKYFLNGTEVTYAQLQQHRFVPGDVVGSEQLMRVDASMPTVLKVPNISTTGSSQGLVDELQFAFTWSSVGDMQLRQTTTPRTYNVGLPNGPATLKVELTITWPADSTTAGRQLNTLKLPPINFVLQQVAAPLPELS
jgi:alternate signal-mediated exported protein